MAFKPNEDMADRDPKQESGLRKDLGETRQANQIFSSVASAREAVQKRGKQFDDSQLRSALELAQFSKLSDKEKFFLQRRLKEELQIDLPEDLRVDQGVLSEEEITDSAPSAVGSKSQGQEPVLDDASEEDEELIDIAVAEIRRQFERAQADATKFSIDAVIDQYKKALGEKGVQAVKKQLTKQNITDLQEGGTFEVGEVHGRPPQEVRTRRPQFERFEIRNGKLYEIGQYEDGRESVIESRRIQQPDWYPRIKSDPEKVREFLDELADIYKNTNPREVTVYVKRERGRSGPIVGFVAKFTRLAEERDMPSDQGIINAANRAEEEGKKYWEGVGVSRWKDEQKREIIQKCQQEKIVELKKKLVVQVEERTEERAKETPETPTDKPAETLTPEQVGMSAELAGKVRAEAEKNLVREFAAALKKKYPKMDENLARQNVAVIVSDEDKQAVFQQALRNYRNKKKK